MLRQCAFACVTVALLVLSGLAQAAPAVVTVGADVWSRPRSGAQFARLPGLRALVDIYERQPEGRFVVHHGSGDEASLWAEEMRSWLVALGIPAEDVRLEVDPAVDGVIQVEVRAYGGSR